MEQSNLQPHKRRVEVFSAGCATCRETITLVQTLVGETQEVQVHDMRRATVARRAKSLGIRSVPAVVIDGKLAGCCAGRGPDEATLRAEGLGGS